MKSVHSRGLGFAFLLAFSWCGAAHAVPVELDFSGVVTNDSTMAGANGGDTITFKVIADNGGASLNSQTWSWSDLLSATIVAGSYSGATTGALSGFGSFATNASGQLATLNFGVLQSGTDSNGNTGFQYYMDGGNPIWGTDDNVNEIGSVPTPNIENTTISLVSATPLPAALPLFASGLGALGLFAARRKRKAIA